MVIKNFERIEIKCTRHDHRLTFRLNKTIAKLAEVVGDDSSLAQDVCFYRWSVGILDVNGTRARINATATGYEILGKRSARNSKERIPIGEKEIRGATNKNTFISHASIGQNGWRYSRYEANKCESVVRLFSLKTMLVAGVWRIGREDIFEEASSQFSNRPC